MKTWKHWILVGILAISAFVFAFSCNGGNSLNGTWVDSRNGSTIEFKGENFIITGSGSVNNTGSPFISSSTGTYLLLPDNRIEFLFSGGSRREDSFRRNENVIEINYGRFTRKK